MNLRDLPSKEDIQGDNNKIYFAVGNLILISSYHDNKPSFMDRFVKIARRYRNDISPNEIYDSFINMDVVKLFYNEHEAYKYSETLLLSKKGNLYQPAIFKVRYTGSNQNNHETIEIHIQSFSTQEDFNLLNLNNCYKDNQEGYVLKTNCLSVPRNELIPLEGILKVQGLCGLAANIHLDYKNIENESHFFQNEDNTSNRCVIL